MKQEDLNKTQGGEKVWGTVGTSGIHSTGLTTNEGEG